MKKLYAQDLKKKREDLKRELENVEAQIVKRFQLVIDEYSSYMSPEHKTYCINNSLHDISYSKMLDITIQTEDNYIKVNNNQLTIFN